MEPMSGYAVSGNIKGRACDDFGVAQPGVAWPVGLIQPAPGVCVPGVVHPGVDAPAGVCVPEGAIANVLEGGSSENPTLLLDPGPPGRSGKYEDRVEILAAFGVESGV
jgi:hypothetical protein